MNLFSAIFVLLFEQSDMTNFQKSVVWCIKTIIEILLANVWENWGSAELFIKNI